MTHEENPQGSILDALRSHVRTQGNRVGYTFLKSDDQRVSLTYKELDDRAKQIAYRLLEIAEPGERALMIYPAGLEFIEAFLGCLYAGIVAVPAYPPKKNRNAERILAIARDCSPRLILCTSETKRSVLGDFAAAVPGSNVVITDDLAASRRGSLPTDTLDKLAFLQYTSGSTAEPKGVMITHGNIAANEHAIMTNFQHTRNDVAVSWLPMFHDMGLIGGVLQPLFVGFPCYLMAPATFIREPVRWLRAITEFKGVFSGAPNFAYDLCTRKISQSEKRTLDLRSWVAFNGAEPVRADTQERFATAFEACGFRPNAFFPCYGMAETTLFVAGGPPLSVPDIRTVSPTDFEKHEIVEVTEGHRFVSCGQIGPDLEVRIVDPEHLTPCPPHKVGEIWVHGTSVAQGYWHQPEETANAFQAILPGNDRTWFRTGDYGFLRNGELYVTGRLKDLIISRGRNLYPQDIEKIVERHLDFVEPNGCAAFSVEGDDEDKLIVIVEGIRDMVRWSKSNGDVATKLSEIEQKIDRVRSAIVEEFELALSEIIFVRPTTFPRTSSGKVQRRLTKKLLLSGDLEIVYQPQDQQPVVEVTRHLESHGLDTAIRNIIRDWAQHENPAAPPIDVHTRIGSIGIDSLVAADLALRIETETGIPLDAGTFSEINTINDLVANLQNVASGSENHSNLYPPKGQERDPSIVLNDIPTSVPATLIRDRVEQEGCQRLDDLARVIHEHREKQKQDGYFLNDLHIEDGSDSAGEIVTPGKNNFAAVLWCINHYTGLNRHPSVIRAATEAIERYGTGAGTSGVSGGRCGLHRSLESRLSRLVEKEATVLFPTGYTANLGAISAIAGKRDLIIFDRECHASIIDGIRMSGARSVSFRHNCVVDLEEKMGYYRNHYENVIVVVESVYSMSGDICPVADIIRVKDMYKCSLYVDEAHSFGIYGKCGAGLCSELGVAAEVDFIMSTLSKATASVGGFVATSHHLAALIQSHARPYLFQACTPPGDIAAIHASLDILAADPSVADRLHQLNRHMRTGLQSKGFDLYESQSPIIPIYITDDSELLRISKELLDRHVFSVPVYFPAVEKGRGRFRFIVSCQHDTQQIDFTVRMLDEVVPQRFRASNHSRPQSTNR